MYCVFGQRPALAGQGNPAYLEHAVTMADFEGQSGVLPTERRGVKGPGYSVLARLTRFT
jgi:hypothetical protein